MLGKVKEKLKEQTTEQKRSITQRMFPKRKKVFKAKRASAVRQHLLCMMAAHACFLGLELFVYNFVLFLVIFELVYLWVCYYSYMTLDKCACYSYIALMGQAPILGAWDVLFVGLTPMNVILYIAQCAVYGYFGAYTTLHKVQLFMNAKV